MSVRQCCRLVVKSLSYRNQSKLISECVLKRSAVLTSSKLTDIVNIRNFTKSCRSSTWHTDPNQGIEEVDQQSQDRKCFRCGKQGHMARDCPDPAEGGAVCYRCGGPHFVKECTMEDKRTCFKCGQKGHIASFCTEENSTPYPSCFNCGGNHFVRDCPEERSQTSSIRCYACGGPHHIKDCTQAEERSQTSSIRCFGCGGPHHINDCPQAEPRVCARCGQTGHFAKYCTEKENRVCYRCGEAGHLAMNCPAAE